MPSVTINNAASGGTQLDELSAKTSLIYTNDFFRMLQVSAWKGTLLIVPKVLEMIQPSGIFFPTWDRCGL